MTQKTNFQSIVAHYFKRFGTATPKAAFSLRKDTKLIVTIPSHNEPDVLKTLDSLKNCIPTQYPVEVLIIFNQSETADVDLVAFHQQSCQRVLQWQETLDEGYFLRVQPLLARLPKKHAGVGLARKLVMDEAVRLFSEIAYDGLIVCFDADSQVSANYLKTLEEQHLQTSLPHVFTIFFEHLPTEEESLSEGILYYELFLRYYIQGLKYANFPYAMHTIGSSMACSAQHYALQGGMNRRKAGEDFYFLHKVTPYAQLKEITETTVYPSSRTSDRVPFGTGKAQQDWVDGNSKIAITYQPIIFQELKAFFECVEDLYQNDLSTPLPSWLNDFLSQQNFEKELSRIRKSSKTQSTFLKKFWAWFDGFKVLKAVHFARDTTYPNKPIEEVAKQLLELNKIDFKEDISIEELLRLYREMDRVKI